jgi:hypothetical protein
MLKLAVSDPSPGGRLVHPRDSSTTLVSRLRPSEDLMVMHQAVRPVPSTRRQEPELEGSAGHLLRLCLDLQLDALLLTLGALAADRAQDAPSGPASTQHRTPTPTVASNVPWHRWISEDVDLACRLAAEALAGHAALPPSLGADLGHAAPATIIDDLAARYTGMLGLLQDLSTRNAHLARLTGIDEAIARTEARLAELREHRLLLTPPTGIDLRGHQFLPGEMLG